MVRDPGRLQNRFCRAVIDAVNVDSERPLWRRGALATLTSSPKVNAARAPRLQIEPDRSRSDSVRHGAHRAHARHFLPRFGFQSPNTAPVGSSIMLSQPMPGISVTSL